ncbi:MAG TPA: hypothetical protein VFL83_00720 [Anaeromyxobacter sp.]|nr:hypothetical protein [Anaeromyxobacter sp.]
MRTLLAAALVALALPTAAAAGPVLALRLGWAASAGDAARETPMSEVADGEIPIQLDAFWRFPPHWFGGVYYAYGFGRPSGAISDRCDALGADCSVWTMRVGAQLGYTFGELWRLAPWLAVGIGYEWTHEDASRGGLSGSQTLSGWEFVNVEGGADVKVSGKVSVGPYASFRLGQYSRLDGYGIPSKGVHQWYGVGIRARYDF